MKKLSLLLVLSILFSACGHKFSLQKRRYQKGFYFAAHQSKKHSETNDKGKIVGFEKKKATAQANTGTESKTNDSPKPFVKVPQVSETLSDFKQNEAKNEQVLKTKNLSTSFHPLQALKLSKTKQSIQKQNFLKQLNKKDGGDFLSTVFIGYIVIGLIILFISSIATVGLAQTLLILAAFIVTLIVLYAIGKFFRNIFG